jgi:RNA polymerase sigma-70 factor (ECF subfamily)
MPEAITQDPDWPDVAALQAGDTAALDLLMKRHHAEVTGFIWRMTGNHRDAEELAQETFVRAFFQIQQYRPRAPFAAWLYRIARNICLDYFRSRAQRQKSQNIPLNEAWNMPESAASALQDETTELLQDAIADLPIHLREPLVLTALEGMSHEEAGRRLGISSKAVEVKCYRAREKLRVFLGKNQNA